MTPEELDDLWAGMEVPRSAEELSGRSVARADGLWVALDHWGRRHFLVELVKDHPSLQPIDTQGLTVRVATHRIAETPPAAFVDLVCSDTTVDDTFTWVASEIGTACEDAEPVERISIVASALGRWRWFWDVESDRLSPEGALGLFAELWFLRRWLLPTMQSVASWTAGAGARHDFQWTEASVEVKATASQVPEGPVHRINGLDQLADPESGELFLFSLQVTRDELAANSLPSLVQQLESEFGNAPDALREFRVRLSRRGYSPAHAARYATTYRVQHEAIYSVSGEFPRLTVDNFVGGLPGGIGAITYALSMAACSDWLITSDPSRWNAPGLRTTPP